MKPGSSRIGARPRGALAIAEDAFRDWEQVRSGIAPVIGEDGFRILFSRALHLTRSEFPWLARDQKVAGGPFAELKGSLEGQTPERAEEATRKLLADFTELLNGLIGESLAMRLMIPPIHAGVIPDSSK